MKLERTVSGMWSCMLSFLLSFAGIACLATAFDMAVDMKTMVLCCVISAAVSSLCYALPLGALPWGGAALAAGYLLQSGKLLPSLEALLYRLSRQYNRAYEWPVIHWSTNTADEMETMLTLALCVLGVVIAIITAWTVCRRKPTTLAAAVSLVPFFACLVVTDTIPDLAWLYFLLLGLGMLLLTGTVRRKNEEQANRLSALVALPVALSLLIMLAAFPQDRYNGQENARQMVDTLINMEPIRSIMERFTETGTSGTSIDGRTVNLKTVGVRLASRAEIMRVNASSQKTLYLRGRALDAYDGLTWTESGESYSVLNWPYEQSWGSEGDEIVISTRYAHRMLYVPYYVTSRDMQYVNVGMENEERLTQYSFTWRDMPNEMQYLALYPTEQSIIQSEWSWSVLRQFLHLSEDVKKWAEPLAEELVGDIASPYHKAQVIAEYVRNSATYDTNTRRMPSKETDFAKWFLEDSDTGYCVHFATAATVLLQAAGLPARYVTGYMADISDSLMTVVRAEDAHAWAEYWLPGYGWTVLEATPAAAPEETTAASTENISQSAPAVTDQTDPTQDSADTDTQKPATQQPGREEPRKPVDLTVVWVVLAVGAVIGAAEGQRALRLYLRRRWRKKSSPNQLALLYWRDAVRLANALKERPDPELLELAMYAKFSQYTVNEEQLARFEAYLAGAQQRLKKRNIFCRLWYRLVLVLN